MGYQPNASARSLVTKRSWTIGVVFEERTGVGITHAFFGNILDKFKKYIEKEGYDLLFISESIGSSVHRYIDHCRQKGVDGIIILCTYPDEESIIRLIDSDIPRVIIDHDTNLTNCVYTDNYTSTYNAIKYLIENGHTRIAHIHGDLYSFVGRERFKGYKQALSDYNIPFQNKYLLEGSTYSMMEGYRRGLEIAKLNAKPSAVITASDNLAIGVMKAFQENNIKIPDDISLIGFDNIELSSLVTPSLTTINQDKEQISYRASQCLIKQIENRTKRYEKIKIEGILIERNTVKSIK